MDHYEGKKEEQVKFINYIKTTLISMWVFKTYGVDFNWLTVDRVTIVPIKSMPGAFQVQTTYGLLDFGQSDQETKDRLKSLQSAMNQYDRIMVMSKGFFDTLSLQELLKLLSEEANLEALALKIPNRTQ